MADEFIEKVKKLTFELWDAQRNEIKALHLAIESLERKHKAIGAMISVIEEQKKPN
jgi:hypothetical protein